MHVKHLEGGEFLQAERGVSPGNQQKGQVNKNIPRTTLTLPSRADRSLTPAAYARVTDSYRFRTVLPLHVSLLQEVCNAPALPRGES